MAYTYPLTQPSSPIPSAVTVMPRNTTALDENNFTFSQRVYDFGGESMGLAISLPPMTQKQAADWAAFFLKLKGTFGTFYAGNPAKKSLLGSATGSILVNGGGQTGTALNVDGLSNNLSVAFNTYDHFQLNNRLYVCVANSSSNGSGQSALTIWPKIITAPADNDALTISNSVGIFRLSEPITFSIEIAKIYGFAFNAIEVLA